MAAGVDHRGVWPKGLVEAGIRGQLADKADGVPELSLLKTPLSLRYRRLRAPATNPPHGRDLYGLVFRAWLVAKCSGCIWVASICRDTPPSA
jgi:hypothetical protein